MINIFSFKAFFKSGQTQQAIGKYTQAAIMAAQRPPWEANQFMREEMSTAISNRSAAYFDIQDFVAALADAETVISIRRNWSKGHFRKAKALLGLGRYREAADAVRLGLSFEPNSNVRFFYTPSGHETIDHNPLQELTAFLADIERVEKKSLDEKKLTAASS